MNTVFSYLVNPKKISDLISENQELTWINKSKNDIISNISHEIRNPISLIISILSLLKQEGKNQLSTECLNYLVEIEKASQDTLNFIQDLMEMSKINSGEFKANLSSKIDLNYLFNRIFTTVNYIFLKKDIKIEKNINSNLPKIHLDERRIKQILINLISNSIKYSPEDRIKITITADHLVSDNKIKITVSDKGFGMDKMDLKIALQRYKVIENENSNKVDSFGLGLSLVQHLVKIQNGTMEIQSKKGEGTEVTLFFNL